MEHSSQGDGYDYRYPYKHGESSYSGRIDAEDGLKTDEGVYKVHLEAIRSASKDREESKGEVSGSGRKRKKGETERHVKKTRQTQSCDACRARKVKCDRPPPGKPGSVDEVCSHCQQLNLTCTFNYQPKKRGPPNQYLKRLESGGKSQSPGVPTLPSFSEVTYGGQHEDRPFTLPPLDTPPDAFTSSRTTATYQPNPNRQDTSAPYATQSGWYRSGKSTDQGGPGSGTLAEQKASNATALSNPVDFGDDHPSSLGRDVEKDWQPYLYSTNQALLKPDLGDPQRGQDQPFDYHSHESRSHNTPSSRHNQGGPDSTSTLSPLYNNTTSHNALSHPSTTSQASPAVFIPSPLQAIPPRASNPFDEILPRHMLYFIVDLYFDYLYGLTPFLHRPSFSRDLYSFKEERTDDSSVEEWIALVMALVASTLVQMPRSFVPMKRRDVKELITTTHGMARDWLNKPYAGVTQPRLTVLYMCALTSGFNGHDDESIEYIGRLWALLVSHRANYEESYRTMSPIESELRRRVFWLAVGGEKSLSVLRGFAPIANDTSYLDVCLPSILEDEYITDQELLPKDNDQTSILSGFSYISRLYRLTGQALDKRQQDHWRAPSGLMLQMRINEINVLYDQVMSLMNNCPPELRLDSDQSPRLSLIPEDWDIAATKELRKFMLDPQANRSAVRDAFLVQQANIYVSQQMIRYILLQYRDELMALQQFELTRQSQADEPLYRLASARRNMPKSMFSEEQKEHVAGDLLIILQKIPITVIAVNSMTLVWKVRFVASTLLDALNLPGNGANDPALNEPSGKVQKYQEYLLAFLGILAEIEQLNSMDD